MPRQAMIEWEVEHRAPGDDFVRRSLILARDEEHAWSFIPPGHVRVDIRPATGMVPLWNRITQEPQAGHPHRDVRDEPNPEDSGPAGGTSRNTKPLLVEHAYVVACSEPSCQATYRWTGPAPQDDGLSVIVPRVIRGLAAADWRLVNPDPMEGIEALCPAHNPYGRAFKEAVRQVIREDQSAANRRAFDRELEQITAWPRTSRPWYGSPDPVKRDQEYAAAVDAARDLPANVPSVEWGPDARRPGEPLAPAAADADCKATGCRKGAIAHPDCCIWWKKVDLTPSQEAVETIAKAFDVPVELLGTPGTYENADHEPVRPVFVAGDANQDPLAFNPSVLRPRRRWWRCFLWWRVWPWCDICQVHAPRGHK